MPTKGYDCFIADTDSEHAVQCRVCGTTCDVERNVNGPTSFTSALAKSARLHDLHRCPHANTVWHEQALNLVLEIEKTPSKSIAQIMRRDLEELLQEHREAPLLP